MQILLLRGASTAHSTPGRLYLDGKFECYTLEARGRTGHRSTATPVPDGRYQVRLAMSAQFRRVLPLLLTVHDAEIPIHAGNTADDAHGGILTGDAPGQDWLGQSRVAFDRLFARLTQADEIAIDIRSSCYQSTLQRRRAFGWWHS